MASLSSASFLSLRPTSAPPQRGFLSSPLSSSSSSRGLATPRITPHLSHSPPRSPWFLRAAPSPMPEPPPPEDPVAGLQAVLSRVQDRLQIFFAVLFWMSLFFWGSAWDGRNSSRKKKAVLEQVADGASDRQVSRGTSSMESLSVEVVLPVRVILDGLLQVAEFQGCPLP